MKLTVLTNLFPNPTEPTRGIFNFQQISRLQHHHETTVLAPISWLHYWRRPILRQIKRWENINVNYFPYYYPPGIARATHGLSLLGSISLQHNKYFTTNNCDVIFACWGYPDAFAAACLAKHYKRPLIIKLHGSDVNLIPNYKMRRWQLLWALRQANHIVTVSQALKSRLIELGIVADKIHVIYNGVDELLFYPQNDSIVAASKSKKVILFVGRLTVEKGALDLLSAFIPLAKTQPDLHLQYIGEGAAKTTIQQQAQQAGLAERIHINAPMAHWELNHWYNQATVVCLPSHNEGVPNVLLEAMACGVPVVATLIGGIPEIVTEHTGILVAKGQPKLLYQALAQSLISAWDRSLIIKNSRNFSWLLNTSQLLALLASI